MAEPNGTKLVMTADPATQADAERLANEIGVQVRVVSVEENLPERRKSKPVCVLYLEGNESSEAVNLSLKKVAATDQDVIFFVSRPDPKMAFTWGGLCQSILPGRSRGLISSSEELKVILDTKAEQDELSVEDLRKTLGLTQPQVARIADVTVRTIQNWERSKMPVSESRPLANLAELREILLDHMDEAAIPEWLKLPNQSLKGKKPVEFLEQGRTRDLLWQLHSVATGEPA